MVEEELEKYIVANVVDISNQVGMVLLIQNDPDVRIVELKV